MSSAAPGEPRAGIDDSPAPTPLRAGPLTLYFEQGGLRYIRLGDREVLRRIYVAVRDARWSTVPARISSLEIAPADDGFSVRFTAVHRRGDIHFEWNGSIDGSPEGTIEFRMSGVARSNFLRNRIGICVLHPTPECAGRPCLVETTDGVRIHGKFPSLVSPHQPFKAVRAVSHEVAAGVRARVSFHGDVFEMEDQRNWTDASFKTYSTPLELPFPVRVDEGTTVDQSVTLRLAGPAGSPRERPPRNVFSVRTSNGVPAPRIGLGLGPHGSRLEHSEAALLKALRPAHLRVDLDASDPEHPSTLAAAAAHSAQLGVPVEAAVFLSDYREAETLEALEMLRAIPGGVASLLVFDRTGNAPMPETLELVRSHAAAVWPEVEIGSGTNGSFVELNRRRPHPASVDFFCYSANPQAHARDDATLVENLGGLRETIESARAFSSGKPCAIGPVTLRPRISGVAAAPVEEPGELPPQVDPRQFSIFGAGWTACSYARLAAADVRSVTYFETTGWCGVIERAQGTPAIARFGVTPGSVFPLYHVLADLAEFAGGEVVEARSEEPFSYDGVVLRKGDRVRAILCSWMAEPQTVRVDGVTGECALRRLNPATAVLAMTDPSRFRSEAETRSGRLSLSLEPFEVVRLDWRVRRT